MQYVAYGFKIDNLKLACLMFTHIINKIIIYNILSGEMVRPIPRMKRRVKNAGHFLSSESRG